MTLATSSVLPVGFPTMQSSESMFRVPPFPAFPSASRFVNIGSLADALVRVVRSVDAREGLSMVVGPPGTGKSLLCGILTEHYRKTHEVVVLGETPIDSAAALLRRVLHHLGVKLSSVPDNDLQLALIDRVCSKESPVGGLLILVDEAQSLPTEVLEAIRMTTNIMRRGEPRVCAVVCGGPRLDETLASASMEPFTQRIATRCYLHPLSAAETREYVRQAIRRCGAEPSDTITDEAMSAVHHACSGVPRLINQLMTQSVDCAEAANRTVIGIHEVNVAWAQLQQLPSPMIDEPSLAKQSNVEFGELDEMPSRSKSVVEAVEAELAPRELPFEDEAHAERVFEFPTSDVSDELDFESDDDGPTSDACGTTCGCSPETCERETEACERIDAMAETLEFINDSDDECSDDVYSEGTSAVSEKNTELDLQIARESREWLVEPGDEHGTRHEPPQSVREIESRRPLPAALFGEFEEEELVAVGVGLGTTQSDAEARVSSELESMLHEEIVGMSSDMRLFQFPSGDSTGCRSPSDCNTSCRDIEDMLVDESGDVHSSTESDLVIAGDDMDILIIEDDVNVHGRHEPPKMRREDSGISVDFQAMLTRMRGG